jgi:hypothetical protein
MLETLPEKIYTSAKKEGKQEDIILILEERFGKVVDETKDAIKRIHGSKELETLLRKAVTTKSLDEFKVFMNKMDR